ncbi:MAG: prolipoprotein diacylglyceryl transferase [Oscillospiraceae bacterium]|nr:prolipoprotein diacylglyceryl transferase [Oscillospiraceae bacterium]MDD4414724.1 prolipoprotein diacylglyceryl transferase [Oscillospiraceae bacterium]
MSDFLYGGFMNPIITVFGRDIATYSLAAIAGILISGTFVCVNAKKRGFDQVKVTVALLVSAIGILMGGHILYGITNINKIDFLMRNLNKITSLKLFLACIYEIFGGSVFYGGLFGGLLFGSIYLKKANMNSPVLYDIIACSIPLMHAFGRIGCFLGGCCYGIESKFGFTYHNSLIESANHIRRFPVQLLEALLNLILFLMLYIFMKRGFFKGKMIYIYLIIYPIIRFLLEFLRGDRIRGFILSLSTSQIISVGIILIVSLSLIKQKVSLHNKPTQ